MNKKLESISKEVKKNLRSYVLDLGLGLVSIGFFLYNLLKWEKSSTGIAILITTGVASFIASIVIKALLGEKGFALGLANPEYRKRNKHYVKKAEFAEPFTDKAEDFCNRKRDEKKLKLRKTMLVNNRMHYDTFFNEAGEYLHPEVMWKLKYKRLLKKDKNYKVEEGVIVLDHWQRKILKRAIRLKIYIPDLFTEYEDNLRVYMERDKSMNEVRVKNNSKNTIKGALITFVGVSFTAIIVFDWAKIFSTIFLLAVYFAIGILQLYSNFTYITVDRVNTLDKKEVLLNEFLRENIDPKIYEEKFAQLKKQEELEEQEAKPQVIKEIPKQEFVEVEMTEEEAKAKGLM